MNISAALSINTNMIGGSANGTYIDSDKFKQSDINYFVQVRVTNQRLDMKPRSKLNLVTSVKAAASQSGANILTVTDGGDIGSIDLTKFRDVYGVTHADIPVDRQANGSRTLSFLVGKKVGS
jgi:hypothetical protein